MKSAPRLLFWLIIFLTIISVWINFPFGQDNVFKFLKTNKTLAFREGLDLQGGSSMTFSADMSNISSDQKDNAINAARNIIERRVDLYGVSEPVIKTTVVNGDYRIVLELPGVNINEAKNIVGTTAELSFWEETATVSATGSPSAILAKTNLSGKDLKSTSVTFDPNTGKPQVQLKFTPEGTKKFAEITKRNVGKPLSMVLDNQIIDRPPIVNEPILTGEAVISGDYTTETAKALSTQLNAGALPVPLVLLEEHTVGPTLGRNALQKSLFAGLIGFITIAIFMIVLYGKHGMVASLALLLYVGFMLAIFKLSNLTPYGVTLTLSGIAGFILSVGMAVDANILIFERMKEEVRLGKSPQAVVELGFSRAWSSIRDSNISTLITSAILYQFGTGVVRGFALVLAVGVMVSMFSAVVVTRTFLRFLYGYNR